MTSSDGEDRFDDLSPSPVIHPVQRKNCSRKRLFQEPHCDTEFFSDTSEEQKDLNVIDTSKDQIHHVDRKVSETCLFQAPYCVRKDCFDTSQEQKISNDINVYSEKVYHDTRRASETDLGKRLLQIPHCSREDRFNIPGEQEDSNKIDASPEHNYYASGKSPETYLGERLFQAPQYVREDSSDSSLEKKSNEIDACAGKIHHTAREASKACVGKQLFQVPPCVIGDFSDISMEHAIKVPETCSDKVVFLTPHYRESFPAISDKRKDSNEVSAHFEQVNHTAKRTFNTSFIKRLLQLPPLSNRNDFFDTSEKHQVSNEIATSAEHNYHAAKRSLETYFKIKLLQSLHCVREDASKNCEEQKVSNDIDKSAEQVHLAYRSTPEDFLGETLFPSPHCTKGDFFETNEKLKNSKEIGVCAEKGNYASIRTVETCLDKRLLQTPHCAGGVSFNISEDENGTNGARQLFLEDTRDQITCTRKRSLRAHSFTELSETSKEHNDSNEMNADTEQIYRTAERDRKAFGNAEEGVKKSWGCTWKACHFQNLPQWLQDNDFLLTGHRPPLQSFGACFRSAFRIHTETVNIWTHLAGCALFVGIAVHFLTNELVTWLDKMVIGIFLASAILCLGMSSVFHAVSCHSEPVCKLFTKLDYCGIAALITGSFVPWLHYGFYCERRLRVLYCSLVVTLGSASAALSLCDGFGEPRFRHTRAAFFAGFGMSGLIPTAHYLISKGWVRSVGWLALMAALYLLGAAIYASRVPERFFPGRCDIFFQSHQIFHVLVVAAALVHYHGTRELAFRTLLYEDCTSAIDSLIP